MHNCVQATVPDASASAPNAPAPCKPPPTHQRPANRPPHAPPPYMQLVAPNVVRIAVSTVIRMLSTLLQNSFFIAFDYF